jgi:hypothetical protein
MLDVPSALPASDRILSRRTILVNAGRGIAGVAFLTVTAACGTHAEPEVDPLQAPYDAALADAALARAAATAAPPAIVPALTQIASERARHAQALDEELARAAGRTTPTSSTTESPEKTTATSTSANAAPPPSVADVSNALRRSGEAATKLAPTLSGYRAGLLGSIAASCTAACTVALPAPKAAR